MYLLPAGWHDAESAAELLARKVLEPFDKKAIHKNRILAALRDFGWIHTDFKNGKKGEHNLPKRELAQAGLLAKQNRSYTLRGEVKIQKEFYVVLISAKALPILEYYFSTGAIPELKFNIPKPPKSTVSELPRPQVKAKVNSQSRLAVLNELNNL